jgi:hypothetical protein
MIFDFRFWIFDWGCSLNSKIIRYKLLDAGYGQETDFSGEKL